MRDLTQKEAEIRPEEKEALLRDADCAAGPTLRRLGQAGPGR